MVDILAPERRDGNAAKRFFRRLLKGLHYVPGVIVTDKRGSYAWRNASCFPRSSIGKAAI